MKKKKARSVASCSGVDLAKSREGKDPKAEKARDREKGEKMEKREKGEKSTRHLALKVESIKSLESKIWGS